VPLPRVDTSQLHSIHTALNTLHETEQETMPTQQSPPSPAKAVAWPPETSTSRMHILRDENAVKTWTLSLSKPFLPYEGRYITFESTSWRVALGLAALVDFVAMVLLDCFREGNANKIVAPKRSFFRKTEALAVVTDYPHSFRHDCMQLLDRWDVQIGIFFSLLWFIDAFLKAQWKRNEKLTKLDRQRIMGRKEIKQERAVGGAWSAYYWTIGIQLLLLPVGFFVFVWYMLSGNENQVKAMFTNEKRNTEMEHNFFSIYSTHSLLFALFHFYTMITNNFIGVGIEVQRTIIWRRLIRFALRHPFIFSQRLRIFLTTLRLTKYIGPLMGECAKLCGNASDLFKTLRQHLAVMRRSRNRKKRWGNMGPVAKLRVAAIRTQSVVRGIQTRKTVRGFMTVLRARKARIARRMERTLRESMVQSMTHTDLMRLELEHLEEEAEEAKKSGCDMGIDDRRRMYELQDELTQEANELVNKHLLLQPNARFAVVWKVVFVICVLLDISQQALQPKLGLYKDVKTGEAMSLEQFLESRLVPSPITEWEECAPWLSDPEDDNEQGYFARYFSGVTRRKARKIVQRRWYCQEPYVTAQSMWISVLRCVLMQAVLIFGIVRYLDVGMTFFIGELHPKTGVLMPKSFFKRWLFPGLLLELLANPQMETTSRCISRLLCGVIHVGPIRAWRWTVVCFYPLSKVIKSALYVHVWRPVVQQQNQECMERATQKPVQRTLQRSRSTLAVAARRSSFAKYD
jgi:hypothetical protein